MRLTEEQMDGLEDVADRLDASLRATYSGRGMYGKVCFGFSGQINPVEIGAALVGCLGNLGKEIASNATTDSMGLGIIVYFPDYQAPEGYIERNEDDYE